MKQTVFDPLRKKHVSLTPEEQVRQSFIRWLNLERNFPMALMASEYSLTYNKLLFRCDLIVFTKTLRPLLIAECKAPHVRITNAVAGQIIRYNLALKVKYLVITNGTATFACRWNEEKKNYEFITEIPDYKTACEDSFPAAPETETIKKTKITEIAASDKNNGNAGNEECSGNERNIKKEGNIENEGNEGNKKNRRNEGSERIKGNERNSGKVGNEGSAGRDRTDMSEINKMPEEP